MLPSILLLAALSSLTSADADADANLTPRNQPPQDPPRRLAARETDPSLVWRVFVYIGIGLLVFLMIAICVYLFRSVRRTDRYLPAPISMAVQPPNAYHQGYIPRVATENIGNPAIPPLQGYYAVAPRAPPPAAGTGGPPLQGYYAPPAVMAP